MIFGVGLGAPVAGEYGSFGDTTELRHFAGSAAQAEPVIRRVECGPL
jgi:hypothetical protein